MAQPLGNSEVEPKLAERSRSVKGLGNSWQQDKQSTSSDSAIFDEEDRPRKRICSTEGKENAGDSVSSPGFSMPAPTTKPAVASTVRKASAPAAVAPGKAKARAGLRRL